MEQPNYIANSILALTPPKEPGKIASILMLFVRGRTLNRFEAEKYGDHVLNSTISSLKGLGIEIESKWERVPGKDNKPTDCKRYWLKQTQRNLNQCLQVFKRWGYTEALDNEK